MGYLGVQLVLTDNDSIGEALETIEHLFAEAQDEPNDPLNYLIDLISRAIEKYELNQTSIAKFHRDANDIDHGCFGIESPYGATSDQSKWFMT